MHHRSVFPLSLLLLALPLALTGCGKGGARITPDTPTAPAAPVGEPATPRDAPKPGEEVQDEWGRTAEGTPLGEQAVDRDALKPGLPAEGALRTIFFAYDSFDLSPTSLATLRENAELLKAYPDARIAVEGHCDERGTIEYNLALGEKRASAVRDYLVSLGIARSRVRIVTYGEERPIDPGHSESAWSKNRRGEFVLDR